MDPAEVHNVIDAHPGVADRLGGVLRKIVHEGRSTPGAAQKNAPLQAGAADPRPDEFD